MVAELMTVIGVGCSRAPRAIREPVTTISSSWLSFKSGPVFVEVALELALSCWGPVDVVW